MEPYSNWPKIKSLLKGLLPYIIIAGSILFLLKITWMKWGDVIIDLGLEMYAPLEIARGKILYTNIHYIFGTFPRPLHAILYSLFGAHINILIACGISVTFLTAILLYKIARFFMNIFCSCLTALTFIFVCAFGNYVYINNYNFILPYAYPATYGLLFSLAAVYSLIRFIYKKRIIDLAFYSISLSFVLLCKVETAISLLVPAILAILLCPAYKKKIISILFSISFINILIAIYCLFFLKTGGLMVYKNFISLLSSYSPIFLKTVMGVTDLNTNIYSIIWSSLLYIFVLLCFLSFDYILNSLKDNIPVRLFITFTVYLLSFLIIYFMRIILNPYIQYRTLPIICLVTIFYSLFKFFKEKEKEIYISILCLVLFSFLLTARIVLRVSAAHYGFYLLVPGLVSYYLFFYNIIPGIFQNFTKNGLYYLCISVLFILLLVNHFASYQPIYEHRTLEIKGERGSIKYLNNLMGIRYKELIEFLINTAGPDETLVVMPEGVDINFFTGLDNPISSYIFRLPHIGQHAEQQKVISQIYNAKVDYIVIVQRDTTEFGPSSFGVDYAVELFDWIKDNYEVIKIFGPMPFTTPEFGIAVMKRKFAAGVSNLS